MLHEPLRVSVLHQSLLYKVQFFLEMLLGTEIICSLSKRLDEIHFVFSWPIRLIVVIQTSKSRFAKDRSRDISFIKVQLDVEEVARILLGELNCWV